MMEYTICATRSLYDYCIMLIIDADCVSVNVLVMLMVRKMFVALVRVRAKKHLLLDSELVGPITRVAKY